MSRLYQSPLICVFLAFLLSSAGCGSDSSPELDSLSQNSSQTGCENIDGESTDGETIGPPIETGFWKDTDDRIMLYLYSPERGDSGEYSEDYELHRGEMSEDTLFHVESVATNTYPVDQYFRKRVYGELDEVLCTAEELAYPDCSQSQVTTGNLFGLAVSYGSVGEPVVLIASNACGPIDLFRPDELAGAVDPGTLLNYIVNRAPDV